MALSIKHKFTVPAGDSTNANVVQPSNWNDEHRITMAANTLLGRGSSAGDAQEISYKAWGYSVLSADSATTFYTRTGVADLLFAPKDASVTLAKLDTALLAQPADYRADTANKLLKVETVWDAAAFVALTDASPIALNLSTGINFSVTLGGNRTLANPTLAKVGQSGLIMVTQDATGGRTLAFGTAYKFANGSAPTPDTVAGRVNIYSYVVITTTFILLTLQRGVR